jgi:hypothetical protein
MGLASRATLRNWIQGRTTPHWNNAPAVLDYIRGGGGDTGDFAPRSDLVVATPWR